MLHAGGDLRSCVSADLLANRCRLRPTYRASYSFTM